MVQNTNAYGHVGSEIVAMEIEMEQIKVLCFKLHMIVIPLDGPANAFYNHAAVVRQASRPKSTLKKKTLTIYVHI